MSAAVGWVLGYLLNSLWQVPLLFAAAWVVTRLSRRIGPGMEHRIWVSALMLEVVVPGCSFPWTSLLRGVWGMMRFGSGGGDSVVRVTMGPSVVSAGSVLRLPTAMLVGVAVAYGATLAYFAGRLMWGLWRTDAMQRQSERVMLKGEAKWRWDRYRGIFQVEKATLAVSPGIAGPVTVGVRSEVMLIPPGFLDRVTDGDWDAVMAHEFAHMRRRDFVKNVAYGVISLPVAYHPVVWLTRARVAESREIVCDAMAAGAVAGKEMYARSLLRLASLLVEGASVRTFHAIGIFNANIFERRVMKLTERRAEMKGVRRILVAVSCVVLGVATCASAMALRMEVVQNERAGARMTVPATEFQAVYKKPPVYPIEAKTSHDMITGPVVLSVTVSADGMPTEVHVMKSLRPDYDESALVAVRDWRWKPYVLNGSAVAVDTTVTVNYSTTP